MYNLKVQFDYITVKMEEKEYYELMEMTYNEVCNYLKKKYGEIKQSYFATSTCASPNRRIKRTKEGLFIHHIKEDRKIMLSHKEVALKYPFSYQEGENLVYCDFLEHLILHYKIVEEFLTEKSIEETKLIVGFGGIVNFMVPELNDYFFRGFIPSLEWKQNCLSKVSKNRREYEDFLYRFKYLIYSGKNFIFKYDRFARKQMASLETISASLFF